MPPKASKLRGPHSVRGICTTTRSLPAVLCTYLSTTGPLFMHHHPHKDLGDCVSQYLVVNGHVCLCSRPFYPTNPDIRRQAAFELCDRCRSQANGTGPDAFQRAQQHFSCSRPGRVHTAVDAQVFITVYVHLGCPAWLDTWDPPQVRSICTLSTPGY